MPSRFWILPITVITSVLLLTGYQSDAAQEYLHPKQYWSRKINTYQELLKFDAEMIGDVVRQIERRRASSDMDIALHRNPEERGLARESIRYELNALQAELDDWKQLLKSDKTSLDQSVLKLAESH